MSEKKGIKEVYQGGYAFSDSGFTILRTKNLASCVAILAYDVENGFCFLSHTADINDANRHLNILFEKAAKCNKNLKLTIKIVCGDYTSFELIQYIKSEIKKKIFTNYDLKIDNISFEKGFSTMSENCGCHISFNSATGEVGPYDYKFLTIQDLLNILDQSSLDQPSQEKRMW